MPSRNDHFCENMNGKTVAFDVQPYSRGEGVIETIVPRVIKHREFCPRRGNMIVEYETFDLGIRVAAGSETRALLAGRPISSHDTAGEIATIIGVDYAQIARAVRGEAPIVIARCG